MINKRTVKLILTISFVLGLLCFYNCSEDVIVFANNESEYIYKDENVKNIPSEAEIIEKINIYMKSKSSGLPKINCYNLPWQTTIYIYDYETLLTSYSFNFLKDTGIKKHLSRIKIKCKYCNGSGKCDYCGSRGKINFSWCSACSGSGYVSEPYKKCGTCRGKGKVGKTCPICDGSGNCSWCHGAGKY